MKVIIDGIEYAPVKQQEQDKKPKVLFISKDPAGKFKISEVGPMNYPDESKYIEQLPGHAMINRAMLARAWNGNEGIGEHFALAACSEAFAEFCKALGLEK